MNITLSGQTVTQDTKVINFDKNNPTDIISVLVDTDETWQYQLEVQFPEGCCAEGALYNLINLERVENTCTTVVSNEILPFNGQYIMRLKGQSEDNVFYSEYFDAWIKYSIQPGETYNPIPNQYYQIERNIEELNAHPPVPGNNGYWLIWSLTTKQYEESTYPLPAGTLPEISASTSGKVLLNNGTNAYWGDIVPNEMSFLHQLDVTESVSSVRFGASEGVTALDEFYLFANLSSTRTGTTTFSVRCNGSTTNHYACYINIATTTTKVVLKCKKIGDSTNYRWDITTAAGASNPGNNVISGYAMTAVDTATSVILEATLGAGDTIMLWGRNVS